MSLDLYKLIYPQSFSSSQTDRRKDSVSVENDRRKTTDRRTQSRTELQSDIKKDLNGLKSEFKDVYQSFKGYDTFSESNLDYCKGIALSKKSTKNKEIIDLALSPVPLARRLVNIDKNKEKEDKTKAIGLTLIAATNLKEDWRDIMVLLGKSKSQAPEGFYSKYGFFVGTTIEDKLRKVSWGKKILRLDRTIGDLEISKKMRSLMKVEQTKDKFHKEITHLTGKTELVRRRYFKFEGKRAFKTLALAMYRVPILSLLAASALEIPAIVKASEENKKKQIANSALSITLSAVCGATLSAILAPISPALPVMGLGIGYFAGGKLADKIGFKLKEN